MKVYRIVELIHNAGSDNREREFVIERKGFLGRWKEMMTSDGHNVKRNSFLTRKEAENYLLKKYCGHGIAHRYGNTYTYEAYRYYC